MAVSVLFVCMGNICRSPSAEAVFRSLVEESGHADACFIDSAGTIGYHTGSPPDARMRKAASARGYSLESRSRQVTPDDFRKFDHIIAMDRDNLADLERIQATVPDGKATLSMMCAFCREHSHEEVPDPYYGGAKGFDLVLDLLEDACAGFLDHLLAEGRLTGKA